tara:strand:- start:777 stop:1649 length:873 start_codon:yes stop_codon:yes gene_type:complete
MIMACTKTISILLLTISLSYSNSYQFSNRFSFNGFDHISSKGYQESTSSISNATSKSLNNSFRNKIREYMLPIQLATFLYLEYGIDHHVNNNKKSKPNRMDNYFRSQLKWSSSNMDKAVSGSDLLLYGVFLGSVPILPFATKNEYFNTLKASLNVLSLNGIVTDIVKMTVRRQRPDSYFKTRENADDSFRSFFSGHTSTTFAIGTSNAIILSKTYPDKKKLIWLGNLSLAAATGYFRMAGDKHYFSDVIVGGIAGYMIGKLAHRNKDMDKLDLTYGLIADTPMIYISLKI